MIDKNKIEETALEHSADSWLSDDCRTAFEDGFSKGINWFKKNLWHDISETPKIDDDKNYITCLIRFKNGSVDICSCFPSLENKWVYNDMNCKDFLKNFDGWLYIKDLMKEG